MYIRCRWECVCTTYTVYSYYFTSFRATDMGPRTKGVLLEPFVHQVWGHSCVLRFKETTLCKPLVQRSISSPRPSQLRCTNSLPSTKARVALLAGHPCLPPFFLWCFFP
uniref:Kinase n=1 Tax=Marmota marmota marmota TaxID=9994 RepID=A0A8C6EX87_MARMA